jgi:hypothetical protein
MKLVDFESAVASRIQDTANTLATADRDTFILQAVKQRYSKDRPRELVTDVAGNGTSLLSLPAGPGNPSEPFEDGFSQIRALEFPIGDIPPVYIDDEDWQLYRTPTGLKILLGSITPGNSDLVRVTWTCRHTAPTSQADSTIPDADFEAVCDYAGSLCCAAMAAKYAQTRDPSISADAVNYRSKSQEYLGLAKELRRRYDEQVGITDSASGDSGSNVTAALASGDMELLQGSGVERSTHRRR